MTTIFPVIMSANAKIVNICIADPRSSFSTPILSLLFWNLHSSILALAFRLLGGSMNIELCLFLYAFLERAKFDLGLLCTTLPYQASLQVLHICFFYFNTLDMIRVIYFKFELKKLSWKKKFPSARFMNVYQENEKKFWWVVGLYTPISPYCFSSLTHRRPHLKIKALE